MMLLKVVLVIAMLLAAGILGLVGTQSNINIGDVSFAVWGNCLSTLIVNLWKSSGINT